MTLTGWRFILRGGLEREERKKTSGKLGREGVKVIPRAMELAIRNKRT